MDLRIVRSLREKTAKIVYFRFSQKIVVKSLILGSMMNKYLLLIILVLAGFLADAQELPMQNGVVMTCGPQTFTDSGGAAANYSSGEDYTLTICPDIPD